jgi:hypothetical protein
MNANDFITITWHIDDVIIRAKERKRKVSKKDARIILAAVKHYHDCNLGITWETLDYFTDDYYRNDSFNFPKQ